jgi:hypothetical protein
MALIRRAVKFSAAVPALPAGSASAAAARKRIPKKGIETGKPKKK